ncbi:MAG: hypothetical protein IT360_23080 [Gemmatimonadaceae bacterium]|nr:hypothetical protein [Gemmatimonadaceae bacterium]
MRIFPLLAKPRPLLCAGLTLLGTAVSVIATYVGATRALQLTMGWELEYSAIALSVLGSKPTRALLISRLRTRGIASWREYMSAVITWPAFYVFVVGLLGGLYQIAYAALPETYGRVLSSALSLAVASLVVMSVLLLAAFFARPSVESVVRGTPLGTIASVSAHIHLHIPGSRLP